jgi:hypothetical protein
MRVYNRHEMKLKFIPPLLLLPALMVLPACDIGSQPPDASTHEAKMVEQATVKPSPTTEAQDVGKPAETQRQDKIFSRYSCTEDGTKPFTSPFFPTDLITEILPMGKVSATSGHVTPTDHLYVHRDVPAGADIEYVLAPADGAIVHIQRFNQDKLLDRENQSSPMVPDYRLIFMHSCTFFTIFIHLGELAPAVAEKTGEIPFGDSWLSNKSVPIQVKAGDPIAKFGQLSLDWSVHDAETTLAGFVVPEHYKWEPWKIHTVDPFQYYDEPLKSALISKVVRKVDPRAGKIDYDVEGTIAGNWFKEGTIDYFGGRSGAIGYWEGHLSIAYSYIVPSQVRISIGVDTEIDEEMYCRICGGSYGVRANLPDPMTVTPETGLVKYELMSRRDAGRSDHVAKEQLGTTSLGTFLVQHLGDRTIRVEVIAGKTPNEVSVFSDASLIYRR